MSANERVNEVLSKARDLIARPGGWYQGAYESPDGRAFCALGAINRAAYEFDMAWSIDAYVELDCVISEVWPGYASVPQFNDDPGRLQEEVVAMFEKAIAREVIS